MDYEDIVKELSKEAEIKNKENDPKFYDDGQNKAINEEIKLKMLVGRIHLTSLEDDRKARKLYAACTFIYVGGYVLFVLVIFCFYQFYLINHSNRLISNSPIIALLTSTTANVIAALIVVMRYLFPNHRK